MQFQQHDRKRKRADLFDYNGYATRLNDEIKTLLINLEVISNLRDRAVTMAKSKENDNTIDSSNENYDESAKRMRKDNFVYKQ